MSAIAKLPTYVPDSWEHKSVYGYIRSQIIKKYKNLNVPISLIQICLKYFGKFDWGYMKIETQCSCGERLQYIKRNVDGLHVYRCKSRIKILEYREIGIDCLNWNDCKYIDADIYRNTCAACHSPYWVSENTCRNTYCDKEECQNGYLR